MTAWSPSAARERLRAILRRLEGSSRTRADLERIVGIRKALYGASTVDPFANAALFSRWCETILGKDLARDVVGG